MTYEQALGIVIALESGYILERNPTESAYFGSRTIEKMMEMRSRKVNDTNINVSIYV